MLKKDIFKMAFAAGAGFAGGVILIKALAKAAEDTHEKAKDFLKDHVDISFGENEFGSGRPECFNARAKYEKEQKEKNDSNNPEEQSSGTNE